MSTYEDRVATLAGTTAVVTGAAGFIGSHLAAALRDHGACVVGVDRAWRSGEPPQTAPHRGPPASGASVRRIRADLRSIEIEPLVAGADVVFHLAGMPGVWPSWTRFDGYLQANVSATKRLLDACLALGVPRVVIASSSSVYGDGPPGPLAETRMPRPISPYAVTKLAEEQLALAYAARADADLTVIALRYFTVYGPGQRSDMLASRVIRSVLDGTPVRIHGDGSHRRDLVYVGDVVQANLLATRAAVASQVVNVGSGVGVSVNDVLDLVGELMDRPVDRHYGKRRPGDVRATHADLEQARNILGYRPTTDLRSGLTAQIAASVAGSSGALRAMPTLDAAPAG